VEGMWRILQAVQPDDFVFATNETHSIREFIEETFKVLGEDIVWRGKGLDEKGLLKSNGKEVIAIDPRYFRPTEVDILIGDPAKAKKILGWEPKTTFKELVKIMVKSDFEKAKRRAE
jgi:GDPmannose 4,6-dehydratase